MAPLTHYSRLPAAAGDGIDVDGATALAQSDGRRIF
jgi:hypothetical protein